MKPLLVSNHTINDLNMILKKNKSLNEKYQTSLIVNLLLFSIIIIGLFILYKRYNQNQNMSGKNKTIENFVDKINRMYYNQYKPNTNSNTYNSSINVPFVNQRPSQSNNYGQTNIIPLNNSNNPFSNINLPIPENILQAQSFNNNNQFGGNNSSNQFGWNNSSNQFGGNNMNQFGGNNSSNQFGGNNINQFGGNNSMNQFGRNNMNQFGGNIMNQFGGNNMNSNINDVSNKEQLSNLNLPVPTNMNLLPNTNFDYRNYLPKTPRYNTEPNILAYNDNAGYSSFL